MENQYFTHGPNRAYIVRHDGTATFYGDWLGLGKLEITNYSGNDLKGLDGLEPCDMAAFMEIKWRVIRKMQEGGAI
jgi:hypothetical protein